MMRATSWAQVRGATGIETRELNPVKRAGILFNLCPELGPGFLESVCPQAFHGLPRENGIVFERQIGFEVYGARISSRIEPWSAAC